MEGSETSFPGPLAWEWGRHDLQQVCSTLASLSVGVIPKSSNPVHVKENAAIVDFEVTPEDMDLLNCLDKGYHFCWDPTGVA